jgi:TolB-like protein/tetratricopeptide (TPR) repeat protein
VAVLPFENLSRDPEQEYFADGMTEQLIADLATIGDLRVISRTSVMNYRKNPKPVPTIARELRVDGIIEGTIVRDADRVRVTAKLIRGGSGDVLWAQSFERAPSDVMVLQREMARIVTSQIGITLTPQQEARLTSARPIDPDVHQQVLLGRHHVARGTEDALRRSVQYFETAIRRDPKNALAHAGLAEAYTGLNGFYMDPREAMPKAKRAVATALSLDQSLAQAHASLGYIRLVYDWDGPGAERELLRALDLNPTLATARLWYAAFLTSQARYDEAVNEIRRAVDLDPTSGRTHTFGTLFMTFARRYEEAIELARRGLEFEPDFGFTLAFQGVAYAQLGRFAEAVDSLQRAVELDKSPTIRALQAHVLAVAGQKAKAQEIVRQVEEEAKHRYFCPYEIGTVYVSLGDQDTASEWFRKGKEGRADCMAWLGIEPWLDPFRSDARYGRLLREIGLDPAR